MNEFSTITIKDSSIFKAIVTGSPISARTLHQASIGFPPSANHLFTANTLSHVYDDTESFYTKWALVPVNNQKFSKDNPKKKDHYELWLTGTEEKKSAILNWMLEGLLRYLNRGKFSGLREWEDTRSMWSQNSDSVGSFMLEENGWVKFEDKDTKKTDLLAHYKRYCEVGGLTATSDRGFYNQISRRYMKGDDPSFTNTKINKEYCYGGISIIPFDDPPRARLGSVAYCTASVYRSRALVAYLDDIWANY